MKIRRKRKNSGFADTKAYPHANHPAFYKRKKSDDIEYITTTHHPEVKLNGKVVDTIPLTSNINPKERGNSISYVYPKKYVGKRSALDRERNDLSFVDEDKAIIENLFTTLPIEQVRYTSNSKNRHKKRKCHGR